MRLQHRFFDVRRAGLTPVLAHPERYEPVWKDDACLDPLLDAGAHLLLDVCSLVGKYGRAPQQRGREAPRGGRLRGGLLGRAQAAATSTTVVEAIERLEALVGAAEAKRLLSDGPRGILAGAVVSPEAAPDPHAVPGPAARE